MRIYFTTIVWLLTVSGDLFVEEENDEAPLNTAVNWSHCDSATVEQTARPGESVSITCKYSQATENGIKHFCRGDGNFSWTKMISAQHSNYTKREKISLSVDKQRGLFEVNIFTVTQEDSGKYRCALEENDIITCLQEVVLHVLNPFTVPTYSRKGESPPQPEQIITPPTRVRTYRGSDCGSSCGGQDNRGLPPDSEQENKLRDGEQGNETLPPKAIAGIVCGGVIVVVLAVVLIRCRRKLCNRRGETSEPKINTVQSAETTDGDHQYDEIQTQNKEAKTVCTLYSTVNPPADQLHYASVNIEGGEPRTGSDQNDSSHPPAETTLYSTVAKLGEE
ncbi:CMRF35-like molecule 8 [Poecilia formosa]|uniref:CMRF35-like molecule 8 n=1 Tax=Poecilia formosa TaxID=48698 RepID=UPI0007B8BCF8|nr:PREDICTED: CMRF35-like molecule 8 [Poecilia formosa]